MNFVYAFGWLIVRIVTKIFFRIKVYNKEFVPKEGGFLLASNHISYYDPPVLGTWTPRIVYFLGKEELLNSPIKKWFFGKMHTMPVKRGAMDRRAIQSCIDRVKEGHGMIIFPEGTRSKTDDFLPGKAGIGLIAKKANCDIVPVYIHGFNKLKDVFFGKDKLTITFGEKIPASWVEAQTSDKNGYVVISQHVMGEIAKLKENQFAG
ncbi:MAG: 1-acyl-sn-glycerol-3-phosphate acyltransferase [Calditrichaeota bacterium]|nr:MAG: 1-acyl-sn-glycerol-3-phosphate acyltransferase [Calditrichota bacterium]